jgi:site-specific DNA recombinase
VFGYARVSSEAQALGSSLQDQQNAITTNAKTRSLEVTQFFVEAESAVYEKIEKREQMRALMREVRAGDLVLCDKIDRWSRDPEYTYRSVREILEAKASIYFVADACDPSTPEGDTMLGFRVLFAREEHKRIRERLVGTRKLLRDAGYYSEGLPPVGYRRQSPKGTRNPLKNALLIVPDDAALVREVFARCIRGESVNDIQSFLRKKRPARAWDKKLISTILHGRVYLGEVQDSRGVWIKAKHDAILDAGTFSKAQEALASRRLGGVRARADSRTRTWLLRQLGRCGKCGAKMSSAYSAKAEGLLQYYMCPRKCGARYARVDAVDEAIAAATLDQLVELREHLAKAPASAPRAKVIDFAAMRAQLHAKRARLLDAYADDLMSKDELRTKLAEVDAKVGQLQTRETEAANGTPLADSGVRREMLRHVESLSKAWRRANPEQRRGILAELAHEVLIWRGAAPKARWKTADEIAAALEP